MEQLGISVEVVSLGGELFDAEVKLADGRSIFVRVTLVLEMEPRLRTVVEPVHPWTGGSSGVVRRCPR